MMQATPDVSWQETLQFAALVEERLGLHFPANRRNDLLACLAAGARVAKLDRISTYIARLSAPGNQAEWDRLSTQLTVGETYFFRNQPQFTALTEHVLPELIAKRSDTGHVLNIWSAGCSTGEEPYSVAIAVRQMLPEASGWTINILATDIDRQALAQAAKGRFGPRAFRETHPTVRDRFFRPDGTGAWLLSDEIKRMVRFDYLNLASPAYLVSPGQMDVIICRNVTIYFPEVLTQQLVQHFYHRLNGGGWLIVGPAEANLNTYRSFAVRNFDGATLYQRPIAETVDDGAPSCTVVPSQGTPIAPAPLPLPPFLEPPTCSPAPVAAVPPKSAIQEANECALRARTSADQGRLEEARSWSEKAIALNALAADPYVTLGLVLTELGQIDGAIQALKRALFVERKQIAAHVMLGDLHKAAGRAQMARKCWQNAQELVRSRMPEEIVPETGGMTCAQLATTLTHRLRS